MDKHSIRKRFAALFLSLCLSVSLAAPALAAEPEVPEAPPAETPLPVEEETGERPGPLPEALPSEEESPDPLPEEGSPEEAVSSPVEEEAELLAVGTGRAANPPDHVLPSLPGGDAWVRYDIPGGYILFDKNAGETMAVTSVLPSVSIPSSINGVPVKYIGSMTFWNSHDTLSSVTLPNTVEIIYGGAFQGCSKLTEIKLPDSLKYIEDGAFENCTGLRTVSLGKNTTYIGPSAFSGCTNLQQVNNTRSLTFIGHDAFKDCSSLTAMDLSSNWPFYGLSERAFWNCTALQSFQFPRMLNEIESSVFSGCSSLGSDSSGNPIPLRIPDSVTAIRGGAFFDCKNLVTLELPDGITSIGASAFSGCTNWKHDTSFLRNVTTLGKYVFKDCRGLSGTLSFPQSDSPRLKEIPESAFENCSGLQGPLLIPNSVTKIGASAFAGCTGLCGLLTIPGYMQYATDWGNNALKDCSGLEMVFYGGDVYAYNRLCNSSGNEILSQLRSAGKVYYNDDHPPYLIPNYLGSDTTTVVLGALKDIYSNTNNGGQLYIAAAARTSGRVMDVDIQSFTLQYGADNTATFHARLYGGDMLYFISCYGFKPLGTPIPILDPFCLS